MSNLKKINLILILLISPIIACGDSNVTKTTENNVQLNQTNTQSINSSKQIPDPKPTPAPAPAPAQSSNSNAIPQSKESKPSVPSTSNSKTSPDSKHSPGPKTVNSTPPAYIPPVSSPSSGIVSTPKTPTPSKAPIKGSGPNIVTPSPAPNISSPNDLTKFISNAIQTAMISGTLNNLDPKELCTSAPDFSKSMCIQKTTSDIQMATQMINSSNKSATHQAPPNQVQKGDKSSIDMNSENPCANVPAVARDECLKGIAQAKKDNEGSGGETKDFWDKLKYADNFDPSNPLKIAKFNFTEIEKFSKISKIRSGVGHNYTPSTDEYDPTNKNCKSMKHYLIPVGVPNSSDLYAKTPHTFKWMSIKYFSPVDGYIIGVSYKENPYGTESNFKIVSKNNPGYYFGYFHVALLDGLKEGSEVKAGQQIGTFGDENTWGEIAVEVQVKNGKTYAPSFLEVSSEEVFKQFKNKGVNSFSDVIITREYRDANPLACDNTDAGWFIGSGRSGVSDRNFERWQFESTDNWFFFK